MGVWLRGCVIALYKMEHNVEPDLKADKRNSQDREKDDSYERQEGLSPIAIGYSWVVRITTFCLEFAALALLGRFLDVRFGLYPWGLVLGCGIGIFVFITGLLDVARRSSRADEQNKDAK